MVSGNTTMVHFLLGLDAWTVFAAPYAPVTAEPGFLWGSELGMDFQGLLYFLPAASNYVGGDIVSGLLALEIAEKLLGRAGSITVIPEGISAIVV